MRRRYIYDTFVCVRLSSHWDVLKIYCFPFPLVIAVWGTVLFCLRGFQAHTSAHSSSRTKPKHVYTVSNMFVSSLAHCQPPLPLFHSCQIDSCAMILICLILIFYTLDISSIYLLFPSPSLFKAIP